MKKFLAIVLAATVLTIAAWTVPIFYPGTEFILMPLMFFLLLSGVAGPILIPLGVIKQWGHKTLRVRGWLLLFVATSIGYYIGYLIQRPINTWDENERNICGQLVTENLENYRTKNGMFPTTLSQLDQSTLNRLPTNYKLDRFTYSADSLDYDLDIPIPLTSRWHWDKKTRSFKYQD